MKVLIVTYYWPPAGGPGVQRWLLFVKYLSEFGITPIVYVPENPQYPIVDTELTEVEPEVMVLKHPIREPYRWAALFSSKATQSMSRGIITESKRQGFFEKLLLWIRGNCFIPDARKQWVKPSVTFLSKFLDNNPVDVLITTGPPHSLHLIGRALKRKHGVKWVADFRDPWTGIGYHNKLKLTRYARRRHLQLEQVVFDEADLLLVTSPGTQREFSLKTKTPIGVITNGFDRLLAKDKLLDSKFSIVHVGSLLSGRNPLILWQVLNELMEEIKGFGENLSLDFYGVISEEIVSDLRRNNLEHNFKYHGYVSYKESVDVMDRAQVLLLIEIDRKETRSILPGKLYEYMASRRPILALGPEQSDIIAILEETQSGKFFTYTEKAQLKKQLVDWYFKYQEGNLTVSNEGLMKYHRKQLTKQLAQHIQSLV